MWIISGNRDGEVSDNPESLDIDRPRARQHLSFGFGIQRCMGNRLIELWLKLLWEKVLKRFPVIEVTDALKRTLSSFVHGYTRLPVLIHG